MNPSPRSKKDTGIVDGDVGETLLVVGSTESSTPDAVNSATLIHDGGEGGANTPGDALVTMAGDTTDGKVGVDADAAPADEAVQIDEAKLMASAIADESITAAVLPTVKGIVNVFIDERDTLLLTGSAAANRNWIYEQTRLASTSACLILTGTGGADSSLEAIFPSGCVFNTGLVLSGDVTVVVTKTEGDGGVATLSVKFTLENVKANGLMLDGTVIVSTNDLKYYPMVTALKVASNGALTFDGTGKIMADRDAAASSAQAVIHGGGTFTKVSSDGDADGGVAPVQPGVNGWTCAPKAASTYQVDRLTRTLKDCYANAGSTVVSTTYACTKAAWTKDIATATTLTWDRESPSTGKVNAQVTVTAAGADAGVSGTATRLSVPWTCPAIVLPDAGP